MTEKDREAIPAWELSDLLWGAGNGFFSFSEMDTPERQKTLRAQDQKEFTPAELDAQRFCIEIFETENDGRLIASLLRGRVPLSMEVREMLASALESGRIKPTRAPNRPKKSHSEKILDHRIRSFASEQYREEIRALQNRKNITQDAAIRQFADITGRTYDQVKNTLNYNGMAKKPPTS